MDIGELKGVGAAVKEKLQKLGIATVQDLLFHLPFRYEDRSRIWPVSKIQAGDLVQIQGSIARNRVVQGKRRSLEVVLQDETGAVALRFYYFSAAQSRALQEGAFVRCFGEVRMGRTGFELYHPEYRVVDASAPPPLDGQLTPVYPLTEGLQQTRLRQLCQQALVLLKRHPLKDSIPGALISRYQFPELNEAISYLHHPPVGADVSALVAFRHPAQQRFVLEELLAHHFSLLSVRESIQVHPAAVLVEDAQTESAYGAQMLAGLPFQLTRAQQRVLDDISADLAKPVPMLRLVQGDVGSGKTVVAALTALRAVEKGYQAAVMAPTEILAEQHLRSFQQWMTPLGISVGWLAGKVKGKKRDKVLAELAEGEVDIVVGTHALFQDDVKFKALALIVVDEQHRFGVHQRLALKEKGVEGLVPHQLVMTATPIPRTLAMSAYADLDTSVIDELPPGRQKIETVVLPASRREEVIARVHHACREGRQAYWVCTLIEESEALQCQAAEASHQLLQQTLPDLQIGLVHGRQKAQEKAQVMDAFKTGVLDVLVATTVIEVGVDVPNASLIIIENPERLGLAQLHQLRGRVGRGHVASFCVLMYSPPLSQTGRARLQVLRDSDNGFVIAEKDLELRGPGEVLGTRQTGLMQFHMSDLERDKNWLPVIKDIAPTIPHVLREQLKHRWIGDRAAYAEV
ncbi:MAG: ATP-dependent DNA helicase RecG [Pseudomonadales bacterium]|nr:ATP-dependent DNA helicase RecG [Pseudomonadales bacterium]